MLLVEAAQTRSIDDDHSCQRRTRDDGSRFRKPARTISGSKPIVVAVTVLTSLDTRALFEIGLEVPMEEQVERLAMLAQDCGIDGVVCSPREIQALRERVNPDLKSSLQESACLNNRSMTSSALRLRTKRSQQAQTISS